MAQSVIITIATNAEGDEVGPLVVEAMREYIARMEAGTAGRQAEEAFTLREGLGVRAERADSQLVADYLESLRAFVREAPAAKLKELFPALHSVAPPGRA